MSVKPTRELTSRLGVILAIWSFDVMLDLVPLAVTPTAMVSLVVSAVRDDTVILMLRHL